MSDLTDDVPKDEPAGDGRNELEVAKRAQRREQNRRYRERYPEQNAAIRRRWVEANRDRIRESNRQWRANHLERARELNRESAQRAADRMRRDSKHRALARERAKRWRTDHLDEVREYQVRWVAQNHAKVQEYKNRYYRLHSDEVNQRAAARRDADPEPAKAARKAWAERNKERLADLQRARRGDPDIYQAQLAANAAARRLRRRLANAGLPPRKLHPVSAADRRAHEQEASDYFGNPELSEHVRQRSVFTESLAKHVLANGPQMRNFAKAYAATRSRMGLHAVEVEGLMYARAVEVVTSQLRRSDLLTSRDVVAAIRSSKALVWEEERHQQFGELVKALVSHVNLHRALLSQDADVENRARVQHGKPRIQNETLLIQIGLQEVAQTVLTNRLTTADVRRAIRTAKVRVTPLEGGGAGGESNNFSAVTKTADHDIRR
jgi:hypothetical protein